MWVTDTSRPSPQTGQEGPRLTPPPSQTHSPVVPVLPVFLRAQCSLGPPELLASPEETQAGALKLLPSLWFHSPL